SQHNFAVWHYKWFLDTRCIKINMLRRLNRGIWPNVVKVGLRGAAPQTPRQGNDSPAPCNLGRIFAKNSDI
ncbi:MAG: hypothetical protein LBI62_08280, partial [Candidatus Accumulibacter sp.]|nr:hypothetical protein [Accumulibacter sp.]